MSKRKHISVTTKLASALLMLNDIPYEDSKSMSAAQIVALYQFDHHPIRHENGGPDEPWNLQPRLVGTHREKTAKIDIPQSAKARRIDKKWLPFMRAISSGKKPPKHISKWPKRKFKSKKTQKITSRY